MPLHLIFFLGVLSFLSGIIFSSLGLSLTACLIPAGFLFIALNLLRIDVRFAFLVALFVMFGSFYYLWDDYHYRLQVARMPPAAEISGIITDDPIAGLDAQSFNLTTNYGKILIQTGPYPAYAYGDALSVQGKINTPTGDSYGRYLAREKVAATMRNPDIRRTGQGKGNILLAFLFRAKNNVKASFKRLFAPQEAALLSGITLGSNQDISKSFLQNLSVSGVRHLTAINGLHMSILFFMLLGVLASILPRRPAFILTAVIVVLFTALTGFSVSAIRAALMAFIAGLAKEAGRFYSAHNALALAALVLALTNPKVLVFDAGFQLSFLAVFGIIYLMPILRDILSLKDTHGFLAWKETVLITFSAQLMTAPILITQFQNFSLTAFITNLLILWILPIIMALGFLTGIFSFFFAPFALLMSFVLAPLLNYIIFVVNLSARVAVLWNPALGFTGVVIYYAILIFIMYRFSGAKKNLVQPAVAVS